MENTPKGLLTSIVDYLKKHWEHELVLITDGKKYKTRHVHSVKDLNMNKFTEAKTKFGKALAFSLVEPHEYFLRAKERMQKSIDEERLKRYSDIPDDVSTIPEAEFKKLLNRTLQAPGISYNRDTPVSPFLFLDIDLKEQFKVLERDGFIPEIPKSCSKDAQKATFAGEELKKLNAKQRKEVITSYIDFKALEKEAAPNLVLFTGGGLHLWYSLYHKKVGKERYQLIHDEVAGMLEDQDLLGGFVVDRANNKPGRNLRVPFSFNTKYSPAIKVEPLVLAEWEAVSPLLDDAISRTQGMEIERKSVSSSSDASTLEFFQKLKENTFTSAKLGMLDLKHDWRLKYELETHLTLKGILNYFLVNPMPITDTGDGWKITHSPLREDNNPSFTFKDQFHIYKDLATDEQGDFGELIQQFLDIKKEELEMYELIPTTAEEAQWHIMHMVYQKMLTTAQFRDNTKFKFMLPKKDENGGAAKVKVPGLAFYTNMIEYFDQVRRISFQAMGPNATDTGEYLKALIRCAPRVYSFFRYNDKSSTSNFVLPQLYRQTLKWLLQRLNLAVHRKTLNSDIYLQDEGFHKLMTHAYPYVNVSGEGKNIHMGTIEGALMDINLTELPKVPRAESLKKVYTLWHSLMHLPEFVSRLLADNPDLTDKREIKLEILKIIGRQFPLGSIHDIDFPLTISDGNKYIQFVNCFVLYDSDDIAAIGTIIPREPHARTRLMNNSIVDISLPFRYEPDSKTPKWNKFMDFLEYGSNLIKEITAYFLGSVLFAPNGDSRAMFLHGSGSNGKSVFIEILGGLFTSRYASFKEIHDACDAKERGNQVRKELLGRVINISADSSGDRLDSMFKNIVVGETVPIRELYKAPMDAVLTTHMLASFNTLPSIKGESKAFVRRILLAKFFNVVKAEDKDRELAKKILEEEGGAIWPQIIEHAKLFKQKDIRGFLNKKQEDSLYEVFLSNNDLYEFVKEHLQTDIGSIKDPDNAFYQKVYLTKSLFKRHYNQYRAKQDKKLISTDAILYEAETFIQEKLTKDLDYCAALGDAGATKINLGFNQRNKNKLGFKGVYLFVSSEVSGAISDADSRTN